MNLKRATLWALCVVGGLASSRSAQAQNQVWQRDSSLTKGPGVDSGRFEYNGSIAAAFGYDSNLFLTSGDTLEPHTDSFKLSITPQFSVRTKAPSSGERPPYALNASLNFTYYEFFEGTKNEIGTNFSDLRNFGLGAALGLQIAPGARWSGDIRGGVTRSIQPLNPGDTSATFNRTTPSVGAGIAWAPGGGLFSWKLINYDLTYVHFETTRLQRYNNLAHVLSTSAEWRFLPRTALFTDSRYALIRYTSSDTEQPNGNALTTRLGVNGLLSDKVGFLGALGWATTTFESKGNAAKQDFDSFIAQVEGRFYLTPPRKGADEPSPTTITVGATRDWTQSFIGNFFSRERGYASMGYYAGRKFSTVISGGIARLSFPQTFFSDGSPRNDAFTQYAADANLFVGYRFTRRMGAFLNGVYTALLSDANLRIDATNPNSVDNMKYSRFELMLGVHYSL